MFNKVSQTYNRQSSAVQLALNGSAIIILFLLWKTSLLTITVPVQGIVHYLFPITSLGRNGLVCGAGCWKKKQQCRDALILSAEELQGKKKKIKKYRMGDGSTVGRAVEHAAAAFSGWLPGDPISVPRFQSESDWKCNCGGFHVSFSFL